MAPQALLGRYKIYKAGTKKLVEWLVASAGRCCDLNAIIKSLACGLPLKASKKGRKHTDTPSLEIRVQELLKLAQAIANSEPSSNIPESIIQILKDVIAGRQECADWYAAQALKDGGKLEKENETHRYFLMILQKVLELLQAARAKSPEKANVSASGKNPKTKSKRDASQAVRNDKISNLFACLQLEEPSSSPLGKDGPPPSYKSAVGIPIANFRLENEGDESAFATWCFLQDLNDVRSFLRETWLEYSKGEISFLAASSITDTAFGLLRCADEDFVKSTPAHQSTDWNTLVKYLGLAWFSRERAIWLCPNPDGATTGPRNDDSKVNIVELLCPVAFMCLHSYSIDAGKVCTATGQGRIGQRGVDEPKHCGLHRFHQFCSVLWKLAPDIHTIPHTRTCEHIVVDKFVQGLAEIHRTGITPMWVVVTCQIYLDIYDLLGDKHVSHGAEVLQSTFKMLRQVATDVEAYKRQSMNGMQDVYDALDKLDWVTKAGNRFEESNWMPTEGKHERPSKNQMHITKVYGCSASPMERSLPAHAGAILADLKIGMYDVGCKLANHGSFILSTAHLYKALRASGMLNGDWHDMDHVLTSFGTKQPLVARSGPLYDGEAAARHYLLALGMSPQEFAPDARQKNPKVRPARQITITSPLLRGLSDRQHVWKEHGLGYSKSKTIEVVLQTMTAGASRSGSMNASNGSHLRDSFTALQLLGTFKCSILADESQLNFDYASFMIACARLLDTVSLQVRASLKHEDLGGDGYHSALIARLLRCTTSHPAIIEAASIIRDHIAANGKRYIKRSYDQSSGRIPKEARPQIEVDLATIKEARDMMSTMFDYSNTKYVFSGRTMAAYHPKIKPEYCTKDCPGQSLSGSETDPLAHHHGPRIVSFGTAMPKGIVEDGIANVQKDPRKFLQAQGKMMDGMFRKHEAGQMSEDDLRNEVTKILNMGLVRREPEDENDTGTMWAYRIFPDHQLYAPLFEGVILREGYAGPQQFGHAIALPVDVLNKCIES